MRTIDKESTNSFGFFTSYGFKITLESGFLYRSEKALQLVRNPFKISEAKGITLHLN